MQEEVELQVNPVIVHHMFGSLTSINGDFVISTSLSLPNQLADHTSYHLPALIPPSASGSCLRVVV